MHDPLVIMRSCYYLPLLIAVYACAKESCMFLT